MVAKKYIITAFISGKRKYGGMKRGTLTYPISLRLAKSNVADLKKGLKFLPKNAKTKYAKFLKSVRIEQA